MLESIFNFILRKAPWIVRAVFYAFWGLVSLMALLFVKGWDTRYLVDSHIGAIASEVFDKKIAPMKTFRDQQIEDLQGDVLETKHDVKALIQTLGRVEGKLDTMKPSANP